MKPSLYKVFVLIMFLGLALTANADAKRQILALGSDLPDFDLPAVDGKRYTPESFSDARILVVIFTCNHCPTAQAYEERIKALVDDYSDQKVEVLAINPNHAAAVRWDELGYSDLGDTLDEMKIRAEHMKFNFVYADDGPEQTVSELFGPVATPHVFIFDEDRKLRFQGRIDNSEREDLVKRSDTREAIEALLEGRQPDVATTRVFGCSVKWKDKLDFNKRWLEKVKKEEVHLEQANAATLRALVENKGSGKVRVINAWATWCGPCVAEFEDLVNTNLQFRNREFELITVAAHFPDEQDKVHAFLKKYHASMKNYIFADEDKYKLIEALDPEWVGALPHTLVVNEKGEVIYRETGILDFLTLRRVVVSALNNISPWAGLGDN
jgi:thiol-disulfide isomerase/thioredoxin